jgi:acyl carrier protein
MTDVGETVRDIISQSFQVPKASIMDATRAEDVDGWDSLAHATLILRLQRVFKVRLDPAAANAAQDVGALIGLCRKAKA